MRLHLFISLCGLLGLLALGLSPLKAEDWTMRDGTVYRNVKIIKVEKDAVTILHEDGGGLIPLRKLPADLQTRFSYNPTEADLAEAARVQAEEQLAEAERLADQALARAANAAAANASDPHDPLQDTSGGRHYTMADLVAASHLLHADPSDPTHYSMGSLIASSHQL